MTFAPHRVLALVAAMLLAPTLAAPFAGAQGPQDDTALVPRGEYLARATDCGPRHTGDKSKAFAGGLAATLATQVPNAAPADVANALITVYCSAVTADNQTVDPTQQRSWIEGFGEETIETLQRRTMPTSR
jgi:hypothetical protein